MKKRISLLIGGWLFLGCFVSSVLGSDLGTTFEGIDWGSSITSQPGLKDVGRSEKVRYYQDTNRFYVLDGEPVDRVILGFYNNLFFAAYIDIDTPVLFATIKDRFVKKFGEYKITFSAKNNLTVYKWKYKDIKIKLKQWGKSGKMKVAFYYLPLSKMISEEKQEGFQERNIRFVPVEKDKKQERWTIFEW